MEQREQQLLKLGFEKNDFWKYYSNGDFLIYFCDLEELDNEDWYNLLKLSQKALKQAKTWLKEKESYIAGEKSREKEIKQQILDLKNKYRSWLADETQCKLDRSPNFKRETELKAKIEVLTELENKL